MLIATCFLKETKSDKILLMYPNSFLSTHRSGDRYENIPRLSMTIHYKLRTLLLSRVQTSRSAEYLFVNTSVITRV